MTAASARRTLLSVILGTLAVLVAFTAPLADLNQTAAGLGAGPSGRTWILSSMSIGLGAVLLTAAVAARRLPHHWTGRARMGIAALALALGGLGVAGCGTSGGDGGTSSSDASASDVPVTDQPTTTTEAPTTTSTAAATTSTAPATTAPVGSTTSTEPSNGLSPGDPCSLEEGSPDCIDPDGDGQGTYLIGGAACMANAPDPSSCTDLDGDGKAGYPDSN